MTTPTTISKFINQLSVKKYRFLKINSSYKTLDISKKNQKNIEVCFGVSWALLNDIYDWSDTLMVVTICSHNIAC